MVSIQERPFSFYSFSPVATGYIEVGERVKHLVRTTLTWKRTSSSLLSRMKGCQNHDLTLWVILYYCFLKQKAGNWSMLTPLPFLLSSSLYISWEFLQEQWGSRVALPSTECKTCWSWLAFSSLPLAATSKEPGECQAAV